MADGVPFGSYRLQRRIARGGMAEVFLARHVGMEGFERRVAIKRILPHLSESEEFREMFLDEARLAAQLTHPNIVHIYDFGRVEDYYFIGMEYVDGLDIGRIIRQARQRPIPFEHAARIFSDVCAGLHYAHHAVDGEGRQLNLVHRDVTPQNVLVTYDGVVKLVDFGIAKAAWQASRTRPGVVKGKFAYMSPEQVQGRTLDARSDVFSVGICLYELLTGVPLFRRDDVHAAMREIRDGKPIEPERYRADVPEGLVKIMRRALATSRDARYPTAHAMQLDLERFLKSATSIGTAHQLGEFLRREYPPPPGDDTGNKPALRTPATASPAGTERQDAGTEAQPAEVSTDPIPPGEISQDAEELAITTPGKGLRSDDEDEATVEDRRAADDIDPDDDLPTNALDGDRPPAERRRAPGGAAAPTFDGRKSGRTAVMPPLPPSATRRAIVAATVAALTVMMGAVLVFRPWSQGSASPIVITAPAPTPARPPAPIPAPAPAQPKPIAPAKEPPTLDIVSRPPGARVTVDGKALRPATPVRSVRFEPGLHHVTVERKGYQPRELPVQLGEGEHRTLDVELRPALRGRATPKRPTGTVTARSVPWSKVFEGGRLLGTTPMANVQLAEGAHTLTFVNPDLPPHKRTITIRAGEELRLSVEIPK